MRRYIFLKIIFLVILSSYFYAPGKCEDAEIKENTNIEGIYECLCESEYVVTVKLESDNKAVIISECWLPRHYDDRSIKTIEGKWIVKGDEIILKYKNTRDTLTYDIADTLIYESNHSLENEGYPGVAPALFQRTSFHTRSIVRHITLWKKPHDFSRE